MNTYFKERNTAREAVREAIGLSEKVAVTLSGNDQLMKRDFSPVTLADYGVQAVIHRRLAGDFPEDPIVAEEDTRELEQTGNADIVERLCDLLNSTSGIWKKDELLDHLGRGGHTGGSGGRFWTLDPIDGTKGFIRGDQYAIALALIEDGKPVLGILGCPRLELPVQGGGKNRGWICTADGHSATAESIDGQIKQRLAASSITESKNIVMCESVESGHSAHDISSVIARELGVQRSPVRMDSQTKYAAVAAGIADAYFRFPTRADYQEKIWDHAAGAFLVECAGGKVSDISGKPLDFSRGRTLLDNRGVIATAIGIHSAVLDVINRHR